MLDIYQHRYFGTIPKEVYTLLQVTNPNIIKFVDYFDEEEYYVIITELHGTYWTLDNPLLSPQSHIGLRTKPKATSSTGEHSSVLQSLSEEEKKIFKKLPPCDLFECLDMRKSVS